MASSPATPSASPFLTLPLEIRIEIYRYYFHSCRKSPTLSKRIPLWPNPELLDNTSFMLVHPRADRKSQNEPKFPRSETASLLGACRRIHDEAEEVLYSHFMLLFGYSLSSESATLFMNHASSQALRRIARVGFYINLDKAPGSSAVERNNLRDWRKASGIFAKGLLGLRSVYFEIDVPSSPVSTRLYNYMVQKALNVARPYRDVPGLQIRWVGEDLGAHIAQLCAEKTAVSNWEPGMVFSWTQGD